MPPRPVALWDAHPHFVDVHGSTVEVFYRGALAKALNRTVVTIRAMERKGIIPNPAMKDGHERWLYTRDQIEDMVQLAIEEGVFDPQKRAYFSERFVKEARRILRRRPT